MTSVQAVPNVKARAAFFIIVILVTVLISAGRGYTNRQRQETNDFAHMYLSVQAVAADLNPYDPDVLAGLGREHGYHGRVFPHLYPPFFSTVLMSPFHFIGYKSALFLWSVLSMLCLYGGCAALFFVLQANLSSGNRFRHGAYLLLLLSATIIPFYPLYENFRWAQVNPLIFLLLSLFLLFVHRGKQIPAALCLSVAILIKIAPVLLIVTLLIRRQFKTVVYTLLLVVVFSALSAVLIGSEPLSFYVQEVLPTLSYGQTPYGTDIYAGNKGNYSLNGFLSSIFAQGIFGTRVSFGIPGLGQAIYWLLFLAMLCDYIWINIRGGRAPDREAGTISLALMIVIYSLASSITFEHHLICQAVPLTVFGMAFIRRPPTKATIALLVLSWIVLSLDIERSYHRPLIDYASELAQAGPSSLGKLRVILLLMPIKTYALMLLWFCGRNALIRTSTTPG